MSQNFTYNELLALVPSYAERQDAAFIAQVPTFIALAENRLASDMKQQGFQTVVTGTLPTDPVMTKPAFWRETISFTCKPAGTTKDLPVFMRNLEYVKLVYPDTSVVDTPAYYADYNFDHFRIAPTPPANCAFELVFYARLTPLDGANQSSWLTVYAPNALLPAILLEAALWTKSPDKIATWQAQYDAAKASLLSENQERLSDRTQTVTRA
jgi:hypothetical protein